MFGTRTISSVFLILTILVFFFLGGYPLAVALLIISIIGYWELSKAMANPNALPGAERAPLPNKKRFDSMDVIAVISIVLYYGAMVFLNDAAYLYAILIAFIVGILFAYVLHFPKVPIDRIANLIFSIIYCPVFLSFIYMTREFGEHGKWLIWLILISSWGCDTFAYLFGRAYGKKKVFPKLSPNKSLAGCIGGVLSAGILGATYGYFYVCKITGEKYLFIFTAIVCMVGAFMGMAGDLVASGIKRNKGFKDYSKLIPGHGGIMDRFDSTLVCAVAVYALSLVLINIW